MSNRGVTPHAKEEKEAAERRAPRRVIRGVKGVRRGQV
jgi:hypothetical protein